MICCDNCKGDPACMVEIVVMKHDESSKPKHKQGKAKQPRKVLALPIEVCEACLTKVLSKLGTLINRKTLYKEDHAANAT